MFSFTKENIVRYAVGAFVRLPDGTMRQITHVWDFSPYLYIFTAGDSFVAPVFPHQLEVVQGGSANENWNAFYLTDGNWERGYYKNAGGFLVRNTAENKELYVPGEFIRSPEGLRKITHISESPQHLYIFTTGDSFVAPVFPHQLEVVQVQDSDTDEDWNTFYLTDGNWIRGYYRKSGGFFVKNTQKNSGRYVAGALVQLPDGTQRKITQIWGSAQYLNVFTEGDSFVTPVFPPQLDVIPIDAQVDKGIPEQ